MNGWHGLLLLLVVSLYMEGMVFVVVVEEKENWQCERLVFFFSDPTIDFEIGLENFVYAHNTKM